MTLNLKQKSFVFVALSVLLLLIIYISSSTYYLDLSRERYLDDRHQAAESAAKELDQFFRRGSDKLETIANLPLLLSGLPAFEQESTNKDIPAADNLHYLAFKSDIFTGGIYLLNEHGQVFWSEPRDQKIINTPYPFFDIVRESFHEETTGNPRSSASRMRRTGKNPDSAQFNLIGPDGTPVGYLVGAIPADHETIMDILHAKANVIAQIISSDGVVVSSTDPARVMRQLPYPDTVSSLMRKGRDGVVPSAASSFRSIVAYKTLDTVPLILATDESEVTALRDTNALRFTLTAIGVLSTIVVMGTLIFVVRSFTLPVELLTEEARKIASGDMEARFTTNRSDEIGVLAHTLEDMKLRLKSSYDRLLQSEKMSLMGQVVAGIAHELNNPLTIVIGHTELMMMKGVDEKYRAQLTRIHDGVERASKIVRNLLTFARQKKPERKLSDINSIINKTLDLRAYELKVSNVELVTELAPLCHSPIAIRINFNRVFLNLIVNAEQAMLEANGKGRLLIKSSLKGNVIHVVFEDDGPGISDENMRRVFEPFFTTKQVGKGTGLGLAICQGIVAEHGGRLAVQSSPGGGATFAVELSNT